MSETEGWRRSIGQAFGSPGKYIQRAGELDKIGTYAADFGPVAFLLIDGFILDTMGERIRASFAAASVRTVVSRFGGECCSEEIDRVCAEARTAQAASVFGIGGGKCLDTVKVAAVETGVPMVIVPTVASTDAPCSAIAVRYTADGVLDTGLFLPRNPDLVIVDSAVVAAAPPRYIVSGMGDALSTWFEARSNAESGLDNFVGRRYPPTLVGKAVARLCHEVLYREGRAAKISVEQGLLTPAVEAIIEANTLMSGVGFENCGVAAAHGISDAFTRLKAAHHYLHGEKVAFGILCMLVLEGRDPAEFIEAATFLKDVGLPTRLADIGLGDMSDADLDLVADAALEPGASTLRVAVPLSRAAIRNAIIAADAFSSSLGHGPRWQAG